MVQDEQGNVMKFSCLSPLEYAGYGGDQCGSIGHWHSHDPKNLPAVCKRRFGQTL